MSLQVGVDIGGTFTDIVAVKDGVVVTEKVSTTLEDLLEGIRNGVTAVENRTGSDTKDISRFVHGTTAGTNAVIEHEGGTVGLLMTKGFRDTLEIGRENRSDMYDLFIEPQTPTFLAPRERRLEIDERVDATGSVLSSLSDEEVIDAVDTLVQDHHVDAIAICYLFSFLNPEHERRTESLIRERYPDCFVSRSSEVDPQFREYERLVVTAMDAYLKPVINEYVSRMDTEIGDGELDCDIQIMQSRGGITNAELITDKPVTTLLSGPAAAVSGASQLGRSLGYDDIITIDIGGTSSDVSLVQDGVPTTTTTGTVLEYPIRTPMVDITTIGAGGGSLAWLDEANSLHVGPKSAGAVPGPACYDRGGTKPTVTDASVVLGYLDPDYFAGGTMELDASRAEAAIETEIAEPLGYDLISAARGIHQIINTKMAEQLRLHTVEEGIDPREFALFAMGGAGPIHAAKLAEELSVKTIIVPSTPGVLSARGLLTADIEHEHNVTYRGRFDEEDPTDVEHVYEQLTERGDTAMAREGVDEFDVTRYADVRYVGQSFEITLEVPPQVSTDALSALKAAFHDRHDRLYGHRNESDPVEFVTLSVVHTFTPPDIDEVHRPPKTSLADARKTTRSAFFPDSDQAFDTPVYDRASLPFDVEFEGPAIVEQENTTTVVYPSHRCVIDDRGTIFIDTEDAL